MFNYRNHIFYNLLDGTGGLTLVDDETEETSNLPEDDMLWEYVEVEKASDSNSNVGPLVVDVTEDNSSFVLSESFAAITTALLTRPIVFRIEAKNSGNYRYFYLAETTVKGDGTYKVSLLYPYFDDVSIDKFWDFYSSSNHTASLTYTPSP